MSSPDLNDRRLHLVEQIHRLSADQLDALERFLQTVPPDGTRGQESVAVGPAARDWPHAPLHRLSEHGTYLVTAGTYRKEHHFGPADRRDHLEASLLTAAKDAGWRLEAWAVFSNHYHFVGHSQAGSRPLAEWLAQLHQQCAAHVNQLDRERGRQVWFNYWETALTFERSYLARLNYVHQNAIKHGLAPVASQYRWCSASWFERTGTPAQVRTVYSFKTDKLHVLDDFDPV